MNELEYRSAHSKFMDDLSTGLTSKSIRLLEHRYDYEVFGSWFIVCSSAGSELRIVFDGRDNMLWIEKPSDTPWAGRWKSFASYPEARKLTPAEVVTHIAEALNLS